ncbi:MAG: type VI secretion system protein ImpL, partial [Geobacter sp.]|nr:type VI secretion system protein ImpL [Geobacter sp.]
MLRAVFKGVLVFTLLALLLLLLFGLALWIGWPWWVGFFLLIGVAGAALVAVLIRKMLMRRKEQMFVQDVIAQDESTRKSLAPKEQDAARELQARWKEAIDALRKSHLRKQGNPLYVLPWYMVIGESGSGKTTAIQSARLTSPFAEVSRTSGISGTRNCDWWFFEQAIILDTAGRYALPVDQDRDKDEWQKFLTLLARFRKKEPLNGLVVTIAADRLAQAAPETLREDGRTLRKRIEELTRVLGARSPVYVLVTKCDLIQGATHFCEQLPEAALNQAMGYVNQGLSADAATVIDKAVATVGDRLRELRLLLLHRLQNRGAAAAMLLFPEELEKLKDGLAAFAQTIFQENPYQETPLLRGIFFSSGRQEGTPFSHFLSALGLIHSRDVLKGTNKGLFLHDFFARILPTDRNLFRPTSHM